MTYGLTADELALQAKARELQLELANTLFVTISNDEQAATHAWKTLQAESVQNVYILEGGINGWLDTYARDAFDQQDRIVGHAPDQLAYRFQAATGQLESHGRLTAVRRDIARVQTLLREKARADEHRLWELADALGISFSSGVVMGMS